RSYGDWSSDVCSSDLDRVRHEVVDDPLDLCCVDPDRDWVCVHVEPVPLQVGLPGHLANQGADVSPLQFRPHPVPLEPLEVEQVKIGRASCRERGWSWG